MNAALEVIAGAVLRSELALFLLRDLWSANGVFSPSGPAALEPARPLESLVRSLSSTIDETSGSPAPRILLVEDDVDLREAICQALEQEGFRVIGVENGRVALEYLRGHKAPCLVLLDLMMPVMNGWEFRDAQMQDRELRGIPVVVLSADARTELKAQSLGVEKYLKKPIQLDQLVGVVAGYCS